ncbi:retron St85 family RNA-directed DNA polymerase [Burkholderia pseudomallei]|nr:retron St85 family RNA-directed DNA polymerase [Burkholderia pseudomallei]
MGTVSSMSSLATLAAAECCVPESWVNDVVRQGPSRVKTLRIEKSTPGKFRIISRPSAELEILQRWLVLRFFEKMEVHDSAMAFRRGRSILTNAQAHARSRFFVRVDFSNFFPSIRYADFSFALGKSKNLGYFFSEYADARNFIQRICFDSNLRLPIGYISSPTISNAVMFEFDVRMEGMVAANGGDLGNAKVTRYADDIVFSTDKKGGCAKFVDLLRELVKKWASPLLSINENKTIFSSSSGGSAIVTGLRVCSDSHITITREYKDKIRLMLSLHAKKCLRPEDLPKLKGHLNYIRYVAPAFFSTLCAKYTSVIDKLI